ncbi:Aminopeptidase N [Hypsibius exemplaris]|uniref:Aminopeptidase N n=1 Tax=Hypsibius exemplaris TaxID=2072580 RepID=A0A9X6RMK5_HYPEX|nr:Aminopeptidase N [Hypsibius exemplaris]
MGLPPIMIDTNSTSFPASSESAAIYRLPATVQPHHYELFLHIHLPYDEDDTLPDALTTQGSHVNITLRATAEGVRNITFHARHQFRANSTSGYVKRFDKDAVSLFELTEDGDVDGAINVSSVQFLKVDIVVVNLDSALNSDRDYKLKIQFEGVIGRNTQGLYRSQYVKNGVTRYLLTSQFQPTMDRMAFPCFDEPGIRSRFTTILKYPNRFTMTRTNGQADGKPIIAGSWIVQKYTTTPAMPVYLNAFLVSDFALTKFVDRGDAAHALQQGRAMMEFLSREFNQSYVEHLPKLDMAAVPDFAGNGMENWGLILYREAKLLYRPKVSTAEDKCGVAGIVAHQLAHNLFGNVVTCGWWSNVWLNEGVSSYVEYDHIHQANPSWNTKDLFSYWVIHYIFQLDAYKHTHPLYDPNVENNAHIGGSFDVISSWKGASVLHMIKGVLGDAGFNRALKAYVQVNKLGSVEHGDLLREVENVAVEMGYPAGTTSRYLRSWIEESGYPVLTLHRGSGTDPSTLNVDCGKAVLDYPTLPVSDGRVDNFIIANVQQYGFYRVNYERQNWNRIITALPVFMDYPTVTPPSILKSPSIRIPLKLLHNYLTQETHYGPLASARDQFRHLTIMMDGTVHYDLFVEYTRKLLEGGLYINSRWSNSWTDADVLSHDDTEGSFDKVMANDVIIN